MAQAWGRMSRLGIEKDAGASRKNGSAQPKTILLLRSNSTMFDSRVKKETQTFVSGGYAVQILGWDRSSNHPPQRQVVSDNGASLTLAGIKSSFSGGFRRNLLPLMKFQVFLFREIIKKRKEVDCIHACDFDTSFIAALVNIFLRKKFVYDIFDYYVDAFGVPKVLKPIVAAIDHWVMRRADKVVICNEKRRMQIGYSGQSKVVVIHNAPITLNISETDECPNDPGFVHLVYVGIFSPGRLLTELLAVVENRNDLVLHIAGFGLLEEEVESCAARCDRIRFYGKVSYGEALALEGRSDIMLALYDPSIPNHMYAAPNKFYEALMLGKPLVTTKGIGVDEIVVSEHFGVAVDYSQEGLASGIDEVLKMRQNGFASSSRMKLLFREKYSWEKMSQTILSFYAEVLG